MAVDAGYEDYPPIRRLQSDATTAFLRAARSGNLEKVVEYLDTNLDINTANSNGLNALHLASKDGHVEIVTELLKRGAKVDAATKKGNTALHIASLAGQSEVVTILIQYGAAVNIQSQNGFTPLYMAAQENHDQVVKILLSNGANQSLATEDGFTPLAVAMQQGHDKVVSVLLENDSKGRVRLPALHIAAKKDDCQAADLLLQNDHKPDVTSKSGFTPLHIAAHYGNEDIARLLIKRGADVNYLAKHNISPLHVAAKWGKNNMVKILLEHGAVIDAKTRDGLTPLHCAARSGHEQCVTTLLESSAPISARSKNGLAPLHMASQGDHVDAVRVLLYHRAPVDEVTIDYLTSLHVAAHCGHVRVAKLLLDRKADPNARALNGFTPLHIACKKNHIKVVELLLKHGASIESTTESGLTPLHVASFMGCMNIVIFLLQHEANPDVPTVRGETPLHLAARANQTDIIRILLRNGAKVDARAREQQTPLHIASRLGNVDIVMLLLQHGAAVDTTTKDMYTALHIAAKEGQEEVAAILVDNNASVKATTKNGFTPLHVAAKYGNMNVAKILLQKDSKLDAQGKNDITPLLLACHYDHQNVAQLLLEKGASPHLASQNGQTPLHIAARKNQMDIATTLLEHGAKANVESKAGFTPLHLSAQKGHYDMTNLLIEHGADPNHKAKNGLTALHLCAQEDFIRVASILVKNGANVESETETGYRPIHVAAHFGNLSMVRFLLKHGAEIDVKTKQNYTPLHQAAQQGHAHIVSALIEGNASHRARTNDGLTALNIAQKLGYISVMEVLKGLSYDGVTPDNKNWEEKYKVIAPESLQETSLMSDSDDEGGSDALMSEQPYRYLTADLMKNLRDDSLPIDVTRDDDLIHRQVKQDRQEFVQSNNYCAAENFDSNDYSRFLVSFLVDARGGTMKGCRHSGIRLIVPPRRATMPIRVTCRLVKPSKMANPPPLMEGESLATRVVEMGPVGASFLGPVLIDIPHFASVRGKEREIIILRSENGESWKEHDNSADNDDTLINTPFDVNMSSTHSGRITRIITTEFPQYFAVVTRIRQEVHVIGAEGGILVSSVADQVQAVFPPGALTKKIKVGLQAHVIPAELTAKLLGNCVAVSPVITIEPRRRKFHKPISLTLPVPQAANKGMINHYGGETPTLRLLCSIAGGTSEAQWEDVTGSTPLNFMDGRVTFTTTVSARFWLMDCRNIQEVPKMATDLYRESLYVPFITNFVIYSKRLEEVEATLRILCMTDSKEGIHTLEKQEEFAEIVKSRDVETLDGKDLYIEFSGNLVPVTKSGQQLKFTFKAFRQNRLSFHVKVKDPQLDPVARMMFMRDPKVPKGEPAQQPLCVLNIVLPEVTFKDKNKAIEDSNILAQKLDLLKSSYRLDYQEEKGDQPKRTSPAEKKFITDTLQKEYPDAVAQKSDIPLESVDLQLSPSSLEKKTYTEKRRFWEDMARSKRESFQRSESEVSHTSQLTYHDSDSEGLSEVRERSEDEAGEHDGLAEVGPSVDMSECTVAEKAHYFEEQIQKEITSARGSLKSQSSQESARIAAARLSGISVSSEDDRSFDVSEETQGVVKEKLKHELKGTEKMDVKTRDERKKGEKKDDGMEKSDKRKSEEGTYLFDNKMGVENKTDFTKAEKRRSKDEKDLVERKEVEKPDKKDEKGKSKDGKDLFGKKESLKKEIPERKEPKNGSENKIATKIDQKHVESSTMSKIESELHSKETVTKTSKKVMEEKIVASETKQTDKLDTKTKITTKADVDKESKAKATKMQENVSKQQKVAESRSPITGTKSAKVKEEISPKSALPRQKSKEESISKSPPKRDKLKDIPLSKSPPKKDKLKDDLTKSSPKLDKPKEITTKMQSKSEKEKESPEKMKSTEKVKHDVSKSPPKTEKSRDELLSKSPPKSEKSKTGILSPPKRKKSKDEISKPHISEKEVKEKILSKSPSKEDKSNKIDSSVLLDLKISDKTSTQTQDKYNITKEKTPITLPSEDDLNEKSDTSKLKDEKESVSSTVSQFTGKQEDNVTLSTTKEELKSSLKLKTEDKPKTVDTEIKTAKEVLPDSSIKDEQKEEKVQTVMKQAGLSSNIPTQTVSQLKFSKESVETIKDKEQKHLTTQEKYIDEMLQVTIPETKKLEKISVDVSSKDGKEKEMSKVSVAGKMDVFKVSSESEKLKDDFLLKASVEDEKTNLTSISSQGKHEDEISTSIISQKQQLKESIPSVLSSKDEKTKDLPSTAPKREKSEDEIPKSMIPQREKSKDEFTLESPPKDEKTKDLPSTAPKREKSKDEIPKSMIPRREKSKDEFTLKSPPKDEKIKDLPSSAPKREKSKDEIPKSMIPRREKSKDEITLVSLPKDEKTKDLPSTAPKREKSKDEIPKSMIPRREKSKDEFTLKSPPKDEKTKDLPSSAPKREKSKDEIPKSMIPQTEKSKDEFTLKSPPKDEKTKDLPSTAPKREKSKDEIPKSMIPQREKSKDEFTLKSPPKDEKTKDLLTSAPKREKSKDEIPKSMIPQTEKSKDEFTLKSPPKDEKTKDLPSSAPKREKSKDEIPKSMIPRREKSKDEFTLKSPPKDEKTKDLPSSAPKREKSKDEIPKSMIPQREKSKDEITLRSPPKDEKTKDLPSSAPKREKSKDETPKSMIPQREKSKDEITLRSPPKDEKTKDLPSTAPKREKSKDEIPKSMIPQREKSKDEFTPKSPPKDEKIKDLPSSAPKREKSKDEIPKSMIPRREKSKDEISPKSLPKDEKTKDLPSTAPKREKSKDEIPKSMIPQREKSKDEFTLKSPPKDEKIKDLPSSAPKREKSKDEIPKSMIPRREKSKDEITLVSLPKDEKTKDLPSTAPKREKSKDEIPKSMIPRREKSKDEFTLKSPPKDEKTKDLPSSAPKREKSKDEIPKSMIPQTEKSKDEIFVEMQTVDDTTKHVPSEGLIHEKSIDQKTISVVDVVTIKPLSLPIDEKSKELPIVEPKREKVSRESVIIAASRLSAISLSSEDDKSLEDFEETERIVEEKVKQELALGKTIEGIDLNKGKIETLSMSIQTQEEKGKDETTIKSPLKQEKLKDEIPKSMIPRSEKSKDEFMLKSPPKDEKSKDLPSTAPKREKSKDEIPKSMIPRREKSKDEFTLKSPLKDEKSKDLPSTAPKREKSKDEIPKSMIPRREKSKDEFTLKSPPKDLSSTAPKREKSKDEIPKSMIPRREKSKDEFTLKSPPKDEKFKDLPSTAPKREKSKDEIPKSMIPRREKSKDEFALKSPPTDEKTKDLPSTAPKREKSKDEIPKSMIPRREKSKDEFTLKSPPKDEKIKDLPSSAPKREKSKDEIPKSMIPRREKSKDEFALKSPPSSKNLPETSSSIPKREKSKDEIPKSMIPRREKSKDEFLVKSSVKDEKNGETISGIKREKSSGALPKSMIPKREKSKEEFSLKSPPKREKSKDELPASKPKREKSKDEISKTSITKREKSKEDIPLKHSVKREKSKDDIKIKEDQSLKVTTKKTEVSAKSTTKKDESKTETSSKSSVKRRDSKEELSKTIPKKSADFSPKVAPKREKSKEEIPKTPLPKRRDSKEEVSKTPLTKRRDSKEEVSKTPLTKRRDSKEESVRSKEEIPKTPLARRRDSKEDSTRSKEEVPKTPSVKRRDSREESLKSKEDIPKIPLTRRRDSKDESSKFSVKRSDLSKDSDSKSLSSKSSSPSPKASDKISKKEAQINKESEIVTVTKKEKSEEITTQEFEERTRKQISESQVFSGTFTGDPKDALKLFEDTSALKKSDFVTSANVITSKVDHKAISLLEKKEVKSSEIDTGQEKIITQEEKEDFQKKESSVSVLTKHSPDEKREEKESKIKETSLSATQKTLVNLTDDLEKVQAFALQTGKDSKHSIKSSTVEDDKKIVTTEETSNLLKDSAVGALVKLEKDLKDQNIKSEDMGKIVEKSIFQEETTDKSKTFNVKEDLKTDIDTTKKDILKTIVEPEKNIQQVQQKTVFPESGMIESEIFHDEMADNLTRKFEDIMRKSTDADHDIKASSTIRGDFIDTGSTRDSLSMSISEDITKDESSSLLLSSSQAKFLEKDITISPSSTSGQVGIEVLDESEANRQKDTILKKEVLPLLEDAKIGKTLVEGKFVSELSGARVLEILEPENESQSRQDSMDVSSIEIDEIKFSSTGYDFPIKEESLHESPAIDSLDTLERDISMSSATFSEDTNIDYSLPQDNQKKHDFCLEKISIKRRTERDSFEIESPPLISPRMKVKELEIKPVDWMIGDEKIEVSETLEPFQAFDKELEEYQSSLKQQQSQDDSGPTKKFEIPRIEETSSTSFDDSESLKPSGKSKFTVIPVSEQDLDMEKELVENKLEISCQELMDTLQREYDAKTPTDDRLEEMAAKSFHFTTVDDDEDSFDYDKEKYEAKRQKQLIETSHDESFKFTEMPLETKTAVNVIEGEQFTSLVEPLPSIEIISRPKESELLQLYEEQFEETVEIKNKVSDVKKDLSSEVSTEPIKKLSESTITSQQQSEEKANVHQKVELPSIEKIVEKETLEILPKIEQIEKNQAIKEKISDDSHKIEQLTTSKVEQKLDIQNVELQSESTKIIESKLDEKTLPTKVKNDEIEKISDKSEKENDSIQKQSYDLDNFQHPPEPSEMLLKIEVKKSDSNDKKDEVQLLSYKTFDPEEVKKQDDSRGITSSPKSLKTEFHKESKTDIRSKGWDDHKRGGEKREKSHSTHSETSPFKVKKEDFQNVDMSARYAITVLDQVVKKEIAEVKENLEAAKQDLIEELSENSENVIQIKDSPSEFQFKLQPESIPNELPFLYKAPSFEKVSDTENLSSSSSPIAKPRRHGEIIRDHDESSSESSSADKKVSEKDATKTPVVIESESDKSLQKESKDIFESFSSSSPKAASRSGSDAEGTTKDETFSLQPPQPVPRRRQKSPRDHQRVTSESEADVSSSGESNYQSCEYESGSRPCSSDVEAAFLSAAQASSTTASEYETAMISLEHSSSKATSQDYCTALNTLSSRESMKSLNSLSSGQMGSLDSTSELSETLMASEPDLDQDAIDENLENILDDDMKTSGNVTDEEDKPFEFDPAVPCMMKRSSEMIFSQVIKTESSSEGRDTDSKQSDSSTVTTEKRPLASTLDSSDILLTKSDSSIKTTQLDSKQLELGDELSSSTSDLKADSCSFEPDSLEVKYTSTSSIEDESTEGHGPGSGLTLQQQLSMTSSSMSGVSLETVIEKEHTDRNSPDSDSFELVDKPDIIDDFVVVEEVGREADEFDSEGKGICISSTSYASSKNYDRDVENLITEKQDVQKSQTHSVRSTTDLFDFESEESPPQASNEDQYSQSYSDEEQYSESGKKWVEMQFQQNETRLYDLEYERGPLEDIKEEEVADFEAGSSRFGSVGSQKESIGSIGSMRGSFGSTPDNFDALTAKRYFKPTDHDNVSLSSLQEFEHLENAVAQENAKRREQQHSSSQDSSSNGSLPRRYHTSKSGHGDDISLSSVKDFEVLEKACKEAHMIELRAREEEDLLDHESPENRYKLESLARAKAESQGSAAGSFNPSTSGSDDYEKRIKEIDEIIRLAQANVEKIERHDDTTEDISQIDLSTDIAEKSSATAPVTVVASESSVVQTHMSERTRGSSEANVMETSTDSLELEGNGERNYNVMCQSSDSLELKTTLDYPSLSSDSLNNVKDPKEEQERRFSSRRISSDSLEFPAQESQDLKDKSKDSSTDS